MSSGASPEPLVWFVDRSLGRHQVPAALRRAGCDVRVHDDHFSPDTPDAEWLAIVGSKGWIVLTKDQNIRRNPLERRALVTAHVKAFVVTGKQLTGDDMGALLVRHMRRMTHETRNRAAPFLAVVSRSGLRILPLR